MDSYKTVIQHGSILAGQGDNMPAIDNSSAQETYVYRNPDA
ncbi:hypothetical protein GP2143_16526 [marine gamma proteobacterium HTCC2143]|uniref:Uncharacterized protein n=1 Tax=marine gamma proteobacterium HTCC2143 TaxID=247633 RepID=A0Y9S5_9GAMM|nr:hypothetical protein GP2143_16526 [marine gamma proteobacterium HTCC2143]